MTRGFIPDHNSGWTESSSAIAAGSVSSLEHPAGDVQDPLSRDPPAQEATPTRDPAQFAVVETLHLMPDAGAGPREQAPPHQAQFHLEGPIRDGGLDATGGQLPWPGHRLDEEPACRIPGVQGEGADEEGFEIHVTHCTFRRDPVSGMG